MSEPIVDDGVGSVEGRLRKMLGAAIDALAEVRSIALAECDPDTSEEIAALSTIEVVRALAERAAQLSETGDVFHRTGLEAMQEADRLRIALAEQEAALAATHEALSVIRLEASTHTVMKRDRPYRGGEVMVYIWQVVDGVLFAPALQRAAKLDRLRREVCEAADHLDDAAAEFGGAGNSAALSDSFQCMHDALATLRVAEEEEG